MEELPAGKSREFSVSNDKGPKKNTNRCIQCGWQMADTTVYQINANIKEDH